MMAESTGETPQSGGKLSGKQPVADSRRMEAKADASGSYSYGIVRLSQGTRVQRLIWCLVLVGVCTGFLVHLVQLTQQYLSCPVSTEIEMQTDFFEFPDVTICSTNYLSMTYGYDPLPSPVAVPGHNRSVGEMIFDVTRFLYLLNQTDRNSSVPPNPFSTFRHGKLTLNKIAFRAKQFAMPYEIVLLCKFNSQYCSYKNFTVFKDDEMFLCMTFTPSNNRLVNSGPGNGLYLVMFTYSISFFTEEEEINDIPGMKVVLHQRGVRPNMNGPHFIAPLKYKTGAVIESSIQEKLDRPSYMCVDSLPNVTYISDYSQLTGIETIAFEGTAEDCQVRKKQLEYLNECGCLATHLPKPADLYAQARPGVCHDINEHVLFRDIGVTAIQNYTYYTIRNDSWVSYLLKDYIERYYWMYNDTIWRISCYQRVLERQSRFGVDTSDCPVLCRNKYHGVSPWYLRWPNSASFSGMAVQNLARAALNEAAAQGFDNRSLSNLVADTTTYIGYIGVLDLFPKSLSVELSSESWAYPLKNFLSDFGGILGLWTGASLVTAIEVLELAMQCAMLLHGRWTRHRQIRTRESPDSQK